MPGWMSCQQTLGRGSLCTFRTPFPDNNILMITFSSSFQNMSQCLPLLTTKSEFYLKIVILPGRHVWTLREWRELEVNQARLWRWPHQNFHFSPRTKTTQPFESHWMGKVMLFFSWICFKSMRLHSLHIVQKPRPDKICFAMLSNIWERKVLKVGWTWNVTFDSMQTQYVQKKLFRKRNMTSDSAQMQYRKSCSEKWTTDARQTQYRRGTGKAIPV